LAEVPAHPAVASAHAGDIEVSGAGQCEDAAALAAHLVDQVSGFPQPLGEDCGGEVVHGGMVGGFAGFGEQSADTADGQRVDIFEGDARFDPDHVGRGPDVVVAGAQPGGYLLDPLCIAAGKHHTGVAFGGKLAGN
jgi:hypothetical protein